ncbi:MAG TPA: ornithine carbamoyltransferase [Candidatus Obscuribacterales bacterium]
MKRLNQTSKISAPDTIPVRLPLSQRMAPPPAASPLKQLFDENRLRGKDILGIKDLTQEDIDLILNAAQLLKEHKFDDTQTLLNRGQTLVMLFEKPSLRTRVTFEAGMTQLGGHGIYLEGKLGIRETVSDLAKNVERWVDGVMARTFEHQTVVALAENANIPVINGLSDLEHPCQALADFLTIIEHRGHLKGLKIAYVGDGNNVANSLMLLAAKVGAHFVLASPPDYEPTAEILETAKIEAGLTGSELTITHLPEEAAADADVVYTDVWVSMGQEAETASRIAAFEGFTVTRQLMSCAKADSIFMHCLPAHRGQEVAAEVIDGEQSVVFQQAENRLHAQKAILSLVL